MAQIKHFLNCKQLCGSTSRRQYIYLYIYIPTGEDDQFQYCISGENNEMPFLGLAYKTVISKLKIFVPASKINPNHFPNYQPNSTASTNMNFNYVNRARLFSDFLSNISPLSWICETRSAQCLQWGTLCLIIFIVQVFYLDIYFTISKKSH